MSMQEYVYHTETAESVNGPLALKVLQDPDSSPADWDLFGGWAPHPPGRGYGWGRGEKPEGDGLWVEFRRPDDGQRDFYGVDSIRAIVEEFGGAGPVNLLEARRKARARLKAELADWRRAFEGDVYGIVIEDSDGETVDSCWGFYGLDYAVKEGRAMLESAVESARESALELALSLSTEGAGI